MTDTITDALRDVALGLFGPGSRINVIYLTTMILISLALYFGRGVKKPFFAWLFPKEMYRHPSHITDVKIFLITRALWGLGFFNLVYFATYFAITVGIFIKQQGLDILDLPMWVSVLLLFMASDLVGYMIHRWHHENHIIWPFHAVHHSAEVMTPLTAYRIHPAYQLVSRFFRGAAIGIAQGIVVGFVSAEISITALVLSNVGYTVFNLLGSNLRHSHIWLSYGRVLDHIFVSPALHQIHHSIAPEHHNKNYGEVLAIWDWMFGTLYVPKTHEKLEYGLSDAKGNRIQQPHPNFKEAMLDPFRKSWRTIRRRFEKTE